MFSFGLRNKFISCTKNKRRLFVVDLFVSDALVFVKKKPVIFSGQHILHISRPANMEMVYLVNKHRNIDLNLVLCTSSVNLGLSFHTREPLYCRWE